VLLGFIEIGAESVRTAYFDRRLRIAESIFIDIIAFAGESGLRRVDDFAFRTLKDRTARRVILEFERRRANRRVEGAGPGACRGAGGQLRDSLGRAVRGHPQAACAHQGTGPVLRFQVDGDRAGVPGQLRID